MIMNDYYNRRSRARTLLVVEGNHEKEKLFRALLSAYNEIKIDLDNIWVYHTNIYVLIDKIKTEYEDDWSEIDLPFLLSRDERGMEKCYKDDFTDIFLVFDYERHDPRFDKLAITKMQSVFCESTDLGKLYINYPMVEAYMDFRSFPDNDFINRKFSSNMRKGCAYKETVKGSFVEKMVDMPAVIRDILEECKLEELEVNRAMEFFLTHNHSSMEASDIIQYVGAINNTKAYLILAKIKEASLFDNMTYYYQLRKMFNYIIGASINKIRAITKLSEDADLEELLRIQNLESDDINNGSVWVVNTSVLFIYDYNRNLIGN